MGGDIAPFLYIAPQKFLRRSAEGNPSLISPFSRHEDEAFLKIDVRELYAYQLRESEARVDQQVYYHSITQIRETIRIEGAQYSFHLIVA